METSIDYSFALVADETPIVTTHQDSRCVSFHFASITGQGAGFCLTLLPAHKASVLKLYTQLLALEWVEGKTSSEQTGDTTLPAS